MSNVIIVGAQWGDEGKGKIVDYLTEKSDIIVRAQGGNNAGHTVITGENKYVLHLIPSGILWEGKQCVIGNGVVLDPVSLLEEIDGLAKQNIHVTRENLIISPSAHLVMPYHRRLDATGESKRGTSKIGTTGRGIGPTYSDKIDRSGLRMCDLLDPPTFAEKLDPKIEEANIILEAAGQDPLNAEEIYRELIAAGERLAPLVANTVVYLHESLAANKSILFEGAQGTYLDIDFGTYPYVTSSNTTAGGACTGSGVPPHKIDSVVGVVKAYTTRVGEGPFVTENDDFSDRMHGMGREFGATTGRKRRCGWLDVVLLRYAGMVNGIDVLAMTNLDGLDNLETIDVCVAYDLDGKRIDVPPVSPAEFARCKPIYEQLPGWKTDLTGITSFDALPEAATNFLAKVAEWTGIPIGIIGVGPDRAQTIIDETTQARLTS